MLTSTGEIDLSESKLLLIPFETTIIERYRRRESSVTESLIEMYLAEVSVRRKEYVTEHLWGLRVNVSTVSRLNQNVYGKTEEWRNRLISEEYPNVYVDGFYLKHNWDGETTSISALVGVFEECYREILGASES